MKRICLCIFLAASAAHAEQKFMVEGEFVELNTSEATQLYIEATALDLENACKGYRMIKGALKDFAAQTEFPLPNNKYPASDFVGGLLEVSHWGMRLGYHPSSLDLIWENLTGDGDKAFNREERDNVLALWSITTSRTPLNCAEGS